MLRTAAALFPLFGIYNQDLTGSSADGCRPRSFNRVELVR